jgi:uncharacterized caspase-like protein
MLPARPILVRIVLAMITMALGTALPRAETKVALVIGNSNYVSAFELKNPANDAAIVKAALTAIGFKVVLKQDVTEQDFQEALKDFARDASNADIALFYFAGHGVQFHDQNYLLPVDTKLIDSNDIEFDSIAMDLVLAATGKAHTTKIIVLDACRNRISEHSQAASKRSLPAIGATEGFAPITATVGNADGMIVFYSAAPGKEADDGQGATNSPFAQAFAKRIVEQNKKIHDVFRLIIDDVYASTNQFQHPAIAEDELRGEVILRPAETAEDVWARIRKSNDPSTFRQFIKDFPDSPLADAAQAVLDKLDLEGRLRDTEKARREDQQKVAAAAAERAALEQRAVQTKADEEARLAKEKADREVAAKVLAEREAAIEAQRKAAEDLIAQERRKADAAAAEQARIAREKADKDAEVKKLADEAAAAKKKADEANAARQVADREAAEDAALQAAKAAEEARKLEEAKQEAKLEEEARKTQAQEAAAKAMADACAREAAELAQLNEAQEIDAIQALRTHSACASIPAAADRAIKQIAAQKAKLCADDQKTLARVDPKNEEALKATLGTLKCPAIRDTASAQIAKLVDENLRTQKACADEREQLATITLSVPDARNRLSALPQNPACQGLVADIRSAIDSVDKRVADAQGELKRLGCYAAKPTGRFDAATVAAVADYLKGRHASPDSPKITDTFIDELRRQDFLVCVAPQPPAVTTRPTVRLPTPTRQSASPPRSRQTESPPLKVAREAPLVKVAREAPPRRILAAPSSVRTPYYIPAF